MLVQNTKYYYEDRFYFLEKTYTRNLVKPHQIILRDSTGKILHKIVNKKDRTERKER